MCSDKDVTESISELRKALDLINQTLEICKNASTWSVIDLWGGEFVSSFIKRNIIEDLNNHLDLVDRQLTRTEIELADINIIEDFKIPDEAMDRLWDMFLDNLFTDIRVHSELQNVEVALIQLQDKLYSILRNIEKLEY